MANSYVEYTTTEHGTGTGINGLGQQIFTAPTKFLSINDIRAKGYNGSTWTELTITSRGTNTVTLSATPTAGSYSKVRIYRATTSDQLIDFQPGARLSESDLDTAYNQGLFVAQEVSEDAGAIGTLTTGVQNITLGGTTTVDNLTASGNILSTNRPRFQLGMNSGSDTTGGTSDGNDNLITFTNVITDIGNNVTNGNTFTAPVTGLYGFDATITTDYNSDKTNIRISLNVTGGNANQGYSVWNSTHEGYLTSAHISKNIYLTAGQQVKVFVTLYDQNATSNSWDFETATGSTNFSGYLIG